MEMSQPAYMAGWLLKERNKTLMLANLVASPIASSPTWASWQVFDQQAER